MASLHRALHLAVNTCKHTNTKMLVDVNIFTRVAHFYGSAGITAVVTYGGGFDAVVPMHLRCFLMTPASGVGAVGGGGTRTWTTVVLMGHLDVWVYVIQSQHAAFNRSSIAGI